MVIGFYNRKGGVGKTTMAVHTLFKAHDLSKDKRLKKDFEINKILGIDMDEQGSLCQWASGYKWDGEETFKLNGNIDLKFLYTLTNEDKNNYDLIVIDFPPQLPIFEDFKDDVDVFIVPVQGRLSLSSAQELKEIVEDLAGATRVILVPNGTDVRYAVGRKEMELIKVIAGNNDIEQLEVFDFAVPHHQIVRKAEMLGKSAWEVPYGSRAKATKNLETLAEWIMLGKKRAKRRKYYKENKNNE